MDSGSVRVNVSMPQSLFRQLSKEAQRFAVAPGTMARIALNDRYKKQTNGEK